MSQVVTQAAEEPHAVRFYENDAELIDRLCGLITGSLEERKRVIILATSSRRRDIEKSLAARGADMQAARTRQQYLDPDAAHILSGILVNSLPDRARFDAVVSGMIARAPAESRGVWVFDETVALLWAHGLREAALRLETMWSEFARTRGLALCCAYPPAGRAYEQCVEGISARFYQSISPAVRALAASVQRANFVDQLHRRTTSRAEHERKTFGSEEAPGGRYWMGLDGRILWANRAELNLLGYEPEEYVGRHVSEFHAEPEVVADILQRLRASKALYDYPARRLCKNGSVSSTRMFSTGIWKWREVTYICCLTWAEREPVS